MKILHFADSHFSSKRLNECVRNFEWMIDYAKTNDIDMIIGAGDLFDVNTMINSEEYKQAIRLVGELSGIAPVYLIRGNHDPKGSLSAFDSLSGIKYQIKVFNDVDIHEISDKSGDRVSVLMLPYINPMIFNGLGQGVSGIFDDASDYYKSKIKEFKRFETIYKKIVVGHISVYGAEFANNEKIVSNEVMLDVNDLNVPEFSAVMLGHIHKREQVIFSGTNIRYSAPHYRTSYSEKTNSVGFVVWTINDDNTEIELVNTPAKKMVEFKLDVEQTKSYISSGELPFEMPENTDIKIVADIPEGMTAMFNKKKLSKISDDNDGSVLVKLKTIPKTNVRSETIANLNTISEKIREWLNVVDIEINEDIIKKAEILEAIVADNRL